VPVLQSVEKFRFHFLRGICIMSLCIYHYKLHIQCTDNVLPNDKYKSI
jgi:hypothetical protein